MADLAVTFHWAPADMASMSISELMRWRAMAEKRTPAPEKPGNRRKR